MTQREKEERAMKIYVETGVYTINEAREKLGEPRVDDPEADKPLVLTEKAGWLHLDNTPVRVRVEALLPKALPAWQTFRMNQHEVRSFVHSDLKRI